MADDLGKPVGYMARTRAYYQGLGYGAPYEWAHFEDVPFAPLEKPLGKCRIALVTTAAPYQPDKGDQGPGAPYNGAAKFFQVYTASIEGEPDVRISHIAYDRAHTSAEDLNCWFPLKALKKANEEGRIGAVSPRFYGLPTNRSQKTTMEQDAPALLTQILLDNADAALLVANCPVCHQSCALAARHLEAAGIPTVVMGCARDIVEHAGVPRFLFSDFPLGNAAGRPHDTASQDETLALALTLLEEASQPRTTWQSPLQWPRDPAWKLDYSNIERLSDEEIARRRAEFDKGKAEARAIRKDAAGG